MKKALLAILVVLFVTPAAFAKNWGAAVKLGLGENDPQTLEQYYDNAVMYDRELSKSNGILGIEALHEWDLNQADKIGLKLGLDFYGENELKIYRFGTATENTYAIPLTIYYKRDNGIKDWSFFAGAGISYIYSELETSLDENYTEGKVFPHVMAGAEYRFTELFALGLEAKYNFSAKVDKDIEGENTVLSDRSGLSGAVTARFYF